MQGGLLDNILLGLTTALTLNNLFYCMVGVTLGTFIGVIPGFGTLAAMSLLFPLTFYLDPTAGLIMLAGIWYGTTYGGNTSAILLNLPGTPANAVSAIDGYPMAKQGRAGVALLMTTFASFFGASVGIILMMLFSPVVVQVAMVFGPSEYFSLMLMGLIAASVVSIGSPLKGIAMVVFGILLGVVGVDFYTATHRYTFGSINLADGISLIALAMGIFGVTEVIASIRSMESGVVSRDITRQSMRPTRDDVKRSWMPMVRGSAIGSFFGMLPGVGASVSAFMAYVLEKTVSKDPSRFGKGAIEGVMAPGAADNAADQSSFIPTLTLGIPGTASMALIIGVLMIHGITPGPNLINDRPEMFWGLIMSFWIGNLMLLVLNIPFIGIWVRVLSIPYHVLYPAIIMLVCVGVFSVSNNVFDIMAVMVFGAVGYGMRLLGFPATPLLLGFVLGPMMEEHFRRAMLISRGNFSTFVSSGFSLTFILVSAALLAWGLWNAYRAGMRSRDEQTA